MTNEEIIAFDQGYSLGFRAGQLYWRQQMIEGNHRIQAEMAGIRISVTRGNVSLEEYEQCELRRIENDISTVRNITDDG